MKSDIKKIDNKISKLEMQKKIIARSLKYDKRKKRTHRLIQIGALAEKYFNLYQLDISDVEEVFSQFSDFVKSNKLDKHKK